MPRLSISLATLVAVAALADAGCGGSRADAAPSCAAVGAAFLAVARYDLGHAGVDDATARAVTDQLPAIRDSLVAACADGAWSAETRKCLVAAHDRAGIEACERLLTDAQRRDLDRTTRAPAASATPGTPETR